MRVGRGAGLRRLWGKDISKKIAGSRLAHDDLLRKLEIAGGFHGCWERIVFEEIGSDQIKIVGRFVGGGGG
jgi:hypothetical protein